MGFPADALYCGLGLIQTKLAAAYAGQPQMQPVPQAPVAAPPPFVGPPLPKIQAHASNQAALREAAPCALTQEAQVRRSSARVRPPKIVTTR